MRQQPILSLIQADKSWATVMFDPDDTNPDYVGVNPYKKASTSDKNWLIYKFTYQANKLLRIDRADGAYADRAILFS